MTNKSIFGLNENIAGALAYVLSFVSGIIILIMERNNKFVRFHALQSTLWGLFVAITTWVVNLFASIPLIGIIFSPIAWLVGIVGFLSFVFLAFKAFTGDTFKLPIIGDIAWNQIN